MGAWALYLSVGQHPEWRIALIEQSTIGSGASGHSAGVSLPLGRTPSQRDLAARSSALYAEAGSSLPFRTSQATACWIVDSGSEESVRESVVGSDLIEPSPSQRVLIKHALPEFRLGHSEAILWGGTARSHEPLATARSLVDHCRGSACVICWEGVGVGGIFPNEDGADLLLEDGRSVSAARVIVAVGPWLPERLGTIAARMRNVRIKKVVALHIEAAPPADAPAIFIPSSDAYLMPLPRRRQWLFSFRSEQWDCEPKVEQTRIDAFDEITAARTLERYVPGLMASCRGGRAFCDAYAEDGAPMLLRDPVAKQVVFVGAGAGAGFRMAPGLAEKALELVS